MIISLIALLITTIFCTLFGVAVFRILTSITSSSSQSEDIDPTMIFWLGLILICWLLMIFSFWIKIGVVVFVLLTCIGGIILIWLRYDLLHFIKRFHFHFLKNIMLSIVLVIFLFFIIAKSTDPVFHYGSGLYYIQNIKWIEHFPVVPGLGNLHGRFAFNTNWFLLFAFFDFNYLFGQKLYILNIFVVCLCLLFLARKISHLSIHKTNSNILALLIFIFSILIIHGYVNSPITDLPSNILLWITLILFVEKQETNTLSNWDMRSWIIFLLSCFAFTIKVSTAPILLLTLFLFVYSIKNNRNILWKILLIGVVFILPWIIRNIIISGTIVYPISFLQLPWFDWSIPTEYIQDMTRTIHSWAMIPEKKPDIVLAMPFREWFELWLHNKSTFAMVIIAGGFLGSVGFFIFDGSTLFFQPQSRKQDASFFLFLDAYLLISFIYWFISAPDLRFAFGLIIASFMIVITRLINHACYKKIVVDSLLTASFVILIFFFFQLVSSPSFKQYFFMPPQVPEAETIRIQISPGFSILSPTTSDQCWDAPLPCVFNPYPGLTMRGESLSEGFKIITDP